MIFLWRGCMIFCMERLRDFSHSLTHSPTQVACFLWWLHDFFVESFHDFFCGEVA